MEEKCLLVRGGNVWTGDRRKPRAEAVLIKGERIVAVGEGAEVEGHALAKGARTLDLAGETVIPGITEAHLHLMF
mgnify:FL=1